MAESNGNAPNIVCIAALPTRNIIVLPYTITPIDLTRREQIASAENGLRANQRIFLVPQKDDGIEAPTEDDLCDFGTIAIIHQIVHLGNNAIRVMVGGDLRASVVSFAQQTPYLKANILPTKPVPDVVPPIIKGLVSGVLSRLEKLVETNTKDRLHDGFISSVRKLTNPSRFGDVVAANALSRIEDKRAILAEFDLAARLELLCAMLEREIELAGVEIEVERRVRQHAEKSQRDFFVRERIRALEGELDEDEDDEIEKLLERVESIKMSSEAREKVKREIDRLRRMSPGTPEVSMSQTHIEWILDLPWGKVTPENMDLKRARAVLDADHYGMKQVKERVIDYLAVRQMKQLLTNDASLKGPILCFVGPPGVGKTSIARGIAKATKRNFVQMSLGGVRDEAEIRGHRRTYIGAIPGRIISAIKQAGAMNPVFLLDEIDKMSHDFRGDPASAMLEVLDGEQNAAFRDHYLDIPFDLSQVMFITTANHVDTIPPPLLDRLEIIEVPSYTEEEKLQIAKRHLLPKQVAEHGLPKKSVRISEATLRFIIEGYTREAGVRVLSRTLAQIVRKAAVDMLQDDTRVITVNNDKVTEYVGAVRYLRDLPEKEPRVGVVNGLAFTAVGGETLAVECAVMPGSGVLSLTGQLGNIMKESAQAALTWVRANADKFALAADFHKTVDIHVHVPDGAVPKDGPSAGVTMATAMLSALTGRAVRQDVAMTGEITLRGRVLPIGGVKEKLLAAYRAGIRVILLPSENKKDLEDIPPHVLDLLDVRFVDGIGDVLAHALLPKDAAPAQAPKPKPAAKPRKPKPAKPPQQPVDTEDAGDA